MIANELTARAVDLCRRVGRPFPAELRAYASDWQRQGYAATLATSNRTMGEARFFFDEFACTFEKGLARLRIAGGRFCDSVSAFDEALKHMPETYT